MTIKSTFIIRTGLVCLTLLGVLATGCTEIGIPASGNKPHGEINPLQQMHDSPAFRDQQAQPIYRADQPQGMRQPPAQTVPVTGSLRDSIARTPDESAKLINPVAINEASLQYGKYTYETTCAVCHGMLGKGDGTIITAGFFGAPPSLTSPRVNGWEDGRLFHVITYGQGMMWSYKSQLTEMERWATINYVRALQRAESPEPMDLERINQK